MEGREFSTKSVGVAVACGIGAMISGASIIIYSIPVLLQPLQDQFGWSRSAISGAVIPAALTAGCITPLIGKAVDRWGPRIVVLIGVVAFALATMGVAFANESIVRFYALYGIFGLAGTAAGAVAFNKALSGWFHAHRGIVLALVGTGSAVGGAAVPLVTELLIYQQGWRGAYVGLGLIVLALGLPVFFVLFKNPPASISANIPEAGMASTVDAQGLTGRQTRRTPAFWLIIGAICINTFVGFGLQLHVVALLTDRGLTRDDAVAILSIFALGGVAGQIAAGLLLDRVNTARIGVPFFLAALIGLLLFDYGHNFPLLVTAGLLLRIGVGAELSMAPYFLARFFGLKSFGENYGVLYLLATLSGGVGPLVMGFCRDHTGSYNVALIVFEVLIAISVICIALLGPYVYSARPPKHGA
jgi:MFS family permease